MRLDHYPIMDHYYLQDTPPFPDAQTHQGRIRSLPIPTSSSPGIAQLFPGFPQHCNAITNTSEVDMISRIDFILFRIKMNSKILVRLCHFPT